MESGGEGMEPQQGARTRSHCPDLTEEGGGLSGLCRAVQARGSSLWLKCLAAPTSTSERGGGGDEYRGLLSRGRLGRVFITQRSIHMASTSGLEQEREEVDYV